MMDNIFLGIVMISLVITIIAVILKIKGKRHEVLLLAGLLFTWVYAYLMYGFSYNNKLLEAVYGIICFTFLALTIFFAVEKPIFNPKWLSIAICVAGFIIYCMAWTAGEYFNIYGIK